MDFDYSEYTEYSVFLSIDWTTSRKWLVLTVKNEDQKVACVCEWKKGKSMKTLFSNPVVFSV